MRHFVIARFSINIEQTYK